MEPLASLSKALTAAVPVGTRLELTLLSFAFFCFMQSFVIKVVGAWPGSHKMKTEVRNRLYLMPASLVHALVVCFLALVVVNGPDNAELLKDRTESCTPLTRFTTAFAAGYFLYDIIVVLHLPPFDAKFMMHGIVCGAAYWVTQTPYFQYYTIRFLLFELSTPALNLRNFAELVDARPGIIAMCMNVFGVSFVGCRLLYGLPLGWDFVQFLLFLIESPDNTLDPKVLYFSISAVTSMCLLNVVWFILGLLPAKKEPAAAQATGARKKKEK